jgi:predicted HTH domain antitoxin
MQFFPENLLLWANMNEQELLEDVAVMLYQSGKLSLGQASKVANMSSPAFQLLLGRRQVPVNYSVSELMEDVATLQNRKAQHGYR